MYNQCGGTPVAENIVKRAIVICIPREIIKPWAFHLEDAKTFQQIRKFTMRQMHDEFTGMSEGEFAQPLYSLDRAEAEDHK